MENTTNMLADILTKVTNTLTSKIKLTYKNFPDHPKSVQSVTKIEGKKNTKTKLLFNTYITSCRWRRILKDSEQIVTKKQIKGLCRFPQKYFCHLLFCKNNINIKVNRMGLNRSRL